MLGPDKRYFGDGLNYTPNENPYHVTALISLLEAE
jgi:hypothetical protein